VLRQILSSGFNFKVRG